MSWFLFAMVSAIFSALAAVFEKKSLMNLNALDFSWKVSLLNILFSFPLLWNTGFAVADGMSLLILAGKSVLGAASFLFIMNGLKQLNISASLPMMILTPAVVAVVAYFALGESLSINEMSGMAILLCGIAVLQLSQFGFQTDAFKVLYKWRAYRFLWLAVLIFTLTSIIDKLLVGKYKMPPMQFIFYQHIFIFLTFSLLKLLRREPMRIELNNKYWKYLAIIAFATIVYRTTQIEAIKVGSVALVLTVKRTSVFFAALAGGWLFGEKKLWFKLVAIAIMVLGSYLVIA